MSRLTISISTLLLATAVGTLREGLPTAFDRLLPGLDPGPWAWLNAGAAALAVAAWVILAGFLVLRRMESVEDPETPEDPEEPPAEADDPPDEQPDRLPDEPT